MKIIYFSEEKESISRLHEYFNLNNDVLTVFDDIENTIEYFYSKETDIVIYHYFSSQPEFQKKCLKLFDQLLNSNRFYIPCFFVDDLSKNNLYQLYLKAIPLLLSPPENQEEAEKIYKIICRFFLKSNQKVSYLHLQSEMKELEIENEFDIIQNVIQQMTVNLPLISKNPKKIEFALYEVIVNAIEHGNLAITAEEKKQSIMDNTYYQLLEERKNNYLYRARKVYIKCSLTKEYAEYIIRDEGVGFDWKKKLIDRKNFDLLNEHGRGIMMIENFFDIVEYNEKGNQVRLVKYSEF